MLHLKRRELYFVAANTSHSVSQGCSGNHLAGNPHAEKQCDSTVIHPPHVGRMPEKRKMAVGIPLAWEEPGGILYSAKAVDTFKMKTFKDVNAFAVDSLKCFHSAKPVDTFKNKKVKGVNAFTVGSFDKCFHSAKPVDTFKNEKFNGVNAFTVYSFNNCFHSAKPVNTFKNANV